MRKVSVGQLAVVGGRPAFAEHLYVGRPNIGERAAFFERVNDILDRRWLSNHGRYVHELESRIGALLGVRHCVATCNGTAALALAIRASGLYGEVVVPSFTFVATAHALRWQEVTPVFCDVGRDHTLDPAAVEAAVTPRTTGIIGVHLWGTPCQIDELVAVARRHDLVCLFDAARALACTYRGRFIGNFGAAEALSFHATKFVNAFEGGAVVTNDDELAERVRAMSDFGYTAADRVEYVGTNAKMSEVAAAMALTNLDSLDELVAVNAANHERYTAGLQGLPGLTVLQHDRSEQRNKQYVVVELESEFGLSRDRLVEVLRAENVLARPYFSPPCHRMEPYQSLGAGAVELPETDRLAASVFALPTGTAISLDDIDNVCGLIRLAHEGADELNALLATVERAS